MAFMAGVIALQSGCRAVLPLRPVTQTVEPWTFEKVEGRRILTPHFAIHSTLRDAQLEEALPDYLEAAHREYAALVPPRMGQEDRLQTYVFDQRGQWERFAARQFPQRFSVYQQISAGGFSEGATCAAYYIGRSYTLSVLAHEGMHQYLAQNCDVRLPAWLNEGLATYCESFEAPGNRVVFTPRRNTFRINALREALQAKTLLPLADMLATDAGTVIVEGRSAKTRTYYAQAWALVVYLRHGAAGRHERGFNRLLRDLASGETAIVTQAARIRSPNPSGTSFGEAMFRAYITEDLESFEADFERHVHELAGFKKK